MKKMKQDIQNSDNYNKDNTCVIGIPEGEEREQQSGKEKGY